MNLSPPNPDAQTDLGPCGDPGSVEYAYKHGNNYNQGSKVEYQCYSGYRLASGQLVVTCLNNSKWSDLPVCERMPPKLSAAIIGGVMGFFLLLVLIYLPIDFCLFKRRKMLAESTKAKKRNRSKSRPAPFLTYHRASTTPNQLTFTLWQDGVPQHPNGHLPNQPHLLPPGGRNGLLEPIIRDDESDSQSDTDAIKATTKSVNFYNEKSQNRFSYLRRKKRVAPSIEVETYRDYPSTPSIEIHTPGEFPEVPKIPKDFSQVNQVDYHDNQSVRSSRSYRSDYNIDDIVTKEVPILNGYAFGNEVSRDFINNYDPLEGSAYIQESELQPIRFKNRTPRNFRQEIFSTGDHSFPPPYSNYDQYDTPEEPKGGAEGAVLYGNSYYV